jgi:hypothetical protein
MALLEHPEVDEVRIAPQEDLFPPAPPDGLDTAVYDHDERAARADLRRQIAAMELALARLFGSAFPRKGIEFGVTGLGGPRVLSVDELERVRDGLAARIHDVSRRVHDAAYVEEKNRELIEEMIADPASHKWIRVNNADIGEPGCKHWHSTPRWGPLGLLIGWWRVKISSGCPLAKGLPPPDQRWRRSDSAANGGGVTRRGRAGRPDPRRRSRPATGLRAWSLCRLRAPGRDRDRLVADRPTGPRPRGVTSRCRRLRCWSGSSCSSPASSFRPRRES